MQKHCKSLIVFGHGKYQVTLVLSALATLNMLYFALFIFKIILSYWLQYEVGLLHETIMWKNLKCKYLSELLKW